MNQSKSYLVSSTEQILGYHFRKPSLLEQALTHGSYSNGTISYERLEFIGDAALNLAMANYLNVTYPDLEPGDISRLRSANVSNEKLARVAVQHNIYSLVRINSPQLDKQVKKFTEAVKREPKDMIYGGITKKAPDVLADVIEAIAAAIYQDCNFNLDMMWKSLQVVKKLLEPLITADTFDEQPVTALTQFCQKNSKVLQFKPSREGKKTIFVVLIDGEKVGYGSSKDKDIAQLNAARDALEKLNVEKSNLSIKAHKEVEDGEKSTLRGPTIPHSQLQLADLDPLLSLSFSSPDEKMETKEKKEYYSVELRPTKDERDKIEEVRKEPAVKQKVNKLCMKRHCPPPEYQSETKGMSAEGGKGKGEGHMMDPPQHQHPKPALSPVLTASAQPAPGNKACSVSPKRKGRKKLVTAPTRFCQKNGKVVEFETSREGKSTTISEVLVDGEEVVKRLLEPLITADAFKQPMTDLYKLCQKNGKVVQFKPSREGKNTIFEVLIDGDKVGSGSSKRKYIAKLNAARDALKKLNGKKSNLLIKRHKEVEDEEVKQKPFLEGNKACSVSPKRRGRKKLTTALTQFCHKNGKVVEFKTSREGKSTTISEVLVDGEKVGYGSSKHKNIAKLNAARDALEKLNGEKSNLLIKPHKEVEDEEAKQKPFLEADVLRQSDLPTAALRHSPLSSDAESTHRFAPIKMDKDSTLQVSTIPHSQHRLVAFGSLPPISFSSLHEKIETKEKKEYHSVELRPTRDEKDKIEEVRKETAAKQKLNELYMKRHCSPPEYYETEGMSAKEEKVKREGHVADPPQHQHPKPALSPGLTASAQPAPDSEESTKYEESEESTEYEESKESIESEESEKDVPYMNKVDSCQRKTGYNVTVEEGRERRERRVPCCRIDIGWLLFILGFFLGVPWLIGAIMLCFSRVDYREKPGYISCMIAAVLFLVLYIIFEPEKELIIGDLRLLSDKNELMIGDFRLL
ncbi:uncharacterized protein LOC144546267 isoform X2 [Carex rostrata]